MKKKLVSILFFAAGAVVSFSARAEVLFHACLPVEILAAQDRVHVKCAHPETKFSRRYPNPAENRLIVYFAVPTSNKEKSDRLIQLGSAAIVGGKWLGVFYDTSIQAESFGCLLKDCLGLSSVMLVSYPLPTPPLPPMYDPGNYPDN